MKVCGRLAPSPTGVLHFGNARTFLLAWLDLRSRGGEVCLRIEDLDGPRVRLEAVAATLEDLAWMGLDWDRGPLFQSRRLDRYREVLARLAERGLAYPCVCTRRDVERAASAPHAGEDGPRYPGSCRGRYADAEEARRLSGREPCWRFAVPPGAVVDFEDRCAGPQHFEVDRVLGDFVIGKRDGTPAYQLAVVVDDAEQGVNEVLRGEDLLASAARQELLYRALGMPSPRWAHVPLVVGPDGRRLAKRHGDSTLRAFREAGGRPEQLVGMLAAWSGLAEEGAELRPTDLISDFALARVPREPVRWYGPGR